MTPEEIAAEPTTVDPIGYWCGEPISTMTRERLLYVVREMAMMIEESKAKQQSILASWSIFNKAKA